MCGDGNDGAGSCQLARESDRISHARMLTAAEQMPEAQTAHGSKGTPIVGSSTRLRVDAAANHDADLPVDSSLNTGRPRRKAHR